MRRVLIVLASLLLLPCNAFVVTERKLPQQPKNSVKSSTLLSATASKSWLSTAALLVLLTPPALAVSGGGLDYANLDISGSQDFAGGNYKGKDFTQVIAKDTNFAGSNLQGCRFYKAYLARTNFKGADLRGASLEDTSLDGAILTGANAAGAYFSASIADAESLRDVDFTDAQFPSKTLAALCERQDVDGKNPVTGIETRESLMCP